MIGVDRWISLELLKDNTAYYHGTFKVSKPVKKTSTKPVFRDAKPTESYKLKCLALMKKRDHMEAEKERERIMQQQRKKKEAEVAKRVRARLPKEDNTRVEQSIEKARARKREIQKDHNDWLMWLDDLEEVKAVSPTVVEQQVETCSKQFIL